MSKITTRTGAYPDLPGDIRVERYFDKRKLGAITAYERDGAFVISAERVTNYEDPSVLAGNVAFPKGWPFDKGVTVSIVIVDDAQRYLAFRVLERVLSELETK